jgi:hypothetical protein
MYASKLAPGVGLAIAALLGTPAFAKGPMDDDRSGPVIGFEIGPNFVVNDDDLGIESVEDDSVGIGLAGRLGYQFAPGPLELTPEVKVGFEAPGTPEAFQAMGGLRLAFGSLLTPVAFAHAGGLLGDLEGFVWDAGGGLQLNLGRLSLGAEVSYTRAEEQVIELDVPDAVAVDVERRWEWVRANFSVSLIF